MNSSGAAAQLIVSTVAGLPQVVVTGRWTLADSASQAGRLAESLRQAAADPRTRWDCRDIEALDSAGAMLLWRAWQRRLPAAVVLHPEHQRVFERIEAADREPQPVALPDSPLRGVMHIGSSALAFYGHVLGFISLIGQLALDLLHILRHPSDLPRREISANVYKAGVIAMPVSALVGMLIGVALSYLSALQLKQFGADVFIVNILGMGIVRELGPVLVAVLVAGRSGSAMTAQLGVMRVTEEVDALSTMGVSRSLRLVFPKVVALSLVMPLLVLWTTAIALVGGMISAQLQLDIAYGFFIQALPRAVPVANLWIGLCKGLVFGAAIALVACHFGLRVRPNTESLSSNTTSSVVTAITVVIIIDAIFAITTRSIGIPR